LIHFPFPRGFWSREEKPSREKGLAGESAPLIEGLQESFHAAAAGILFEGLRSDALREDKAPQGADLERFLHFPSL
jgi:hypothetical protein